MEFGLSGPYRNSRYPIQLRTGGFQMLCRFKLLQSSESGFGVAGLRRYTCGRLSHRMPYTLS